MSRFVGVTCKLICHGSTFAHCMHCYDQRLTKLTDLSTTHSKHPQALSSADHQWQGLDSWWSRVVTCLSVHVSHTQHSATLHNKRCVPQWLNTSQLTCPLYKVHPLAPLSDDHWWWGLEVRGSDLPVTVHLPHTTQCSTTQRNTTHAARATATQHILQLPQRFSTSQLTCPLYTVHPPALLWADRRCSGLDPGWSLVSRQTWGHCEAGCPVWEDSAESKHRRSSVSRFLSTSTPVSVLQMTPMHQKWAEEDNLQTNLYKQYHSKWFRILSSSNL